MKRWLAITLWGLTASALAELEHLEYFTEEYPPYSYTTAQGEVTGLAVETLKEVWQRTGTPPQPIRVLPWARGYYLLTQKPNVVLFSTARTAVRYPLFKWACPIGYSEYVLLGLSKRALTLTTDAELGRYSIAAVRADASEQLLLNKGMDDTRIVPANRLGQALRMLLSGRVDLVATGTLAANDTIKEMGIDPASISKAYTLSAEELCYAFSRAVSDETVQRFQLGLTGTLASPHYGALQRRFMP